MMDESWQKKALRKSSALITDDEIKQLRAENERLREIKQKFIQAALGPSPMCRECADNDSTCPHDKLPCDVLERAFAKLAELNTQEAE